MEYNTYMLKIIRQVVVGCFEPSIYKLLFYLDPGSVLTPLILAFILKLKR